jgi:hypothetical protein
MLLYYLWLFKYDIVSNFNNILVLSDHFLKLAASLERKGKKYSTNFYGNDDGLWEATSRYILGHKKEGYDWAIFSSLSSQNDWRTLSVEGATEHNSGFRKALYEIVKAYPELIEFWINFDGPYKAVGELIESFDDIESSSDWENLTFYHGTSEKAWEKIQQEGLRPRSETNVVPAYGAQYSSAPEGRSDAIYLTTQLAMARAAARDASRVSKSPGVILKIQGINNNYVTADIDSGETDPVKSLARIGSIAYLNTIPPLLITFAGFLDFEKA